jgi:hypothetical protein
MEGRDELGRFTEKNIWAFVKKNVGNPPKYKSGEELLEKALEYFKWCDDVRKGKYNESHLRMWLGFNRKNWYDYKNHPEYSNTIDFITSFMEGDTEDRLMWAGSTQGAIFKLKNKFGWKDESKQEVNQTTTIIRANFGDTVIQPTSEPEENT